MARISVFGAGYVGLVTGACFADLGHHVILRDVLPEKIEALRRGDIPIYEPGLKEVVARASKRLSFTLDVREAVDGADFLFVCVGTPPTYSGDADLSAVWTVVDELPPDTQATIVMKSTVPVGTGEKVRRSLETRGLGHVGYVSNPEFTAEGTAVRDFMEPDRIIVGAFHDRDGDAVETLHKGIHGTVVRTDVASAEMVKLASNAFLSTRISFINEIANVCELVGADVTKVAKGMGLDHRLGPHFLRAGIGFGGSCLVGDETVLVRAGRHIRLSSLERLYEQTEPGQQLEVLSWHRSGDGPEFLPADVLTRREYRGEILEVRTEMGRRLCCTPDHPFVTPDGLKLAEELTTDDWVPLAQGPAAGARRRSRVLNVVGAHDGAGLEPRRGPVARSHDTLRSGALGLREAALVDVEIEHAAVGTEKNGTHVPSSLVADAGFWRVVGLYLAEGHLSRVGDRRRLMWSFHPTDESELVSEVATFWRSRGVEASVRRGTTATDVTVSSRLLAGFWTGTLGLGANCYEQRLPDAIWDEPLEHKHALLAGMWRGDGSWSYVNGGPSVSFEYGTVSRALADGVLRLLGELGIVASMRVGRSALSTYDTYWLRISGADQVEQVFDFVSAHDHEAIRTSIAKQAERIAPTDFRRHGNAAWVRVVDVVRRLYEGHVYSMEVPPAHTLVTTSGLTVHNCFPKDVSALKQLAGNSGYHFQLLSAVIEVNELQKRRVIGKLQRHLGTLRGRTVALLGLAFKPGTDDMREAPSLVLASRLIAEGATVRAWDPVAGGEALPAGVEVTPTVLDAVRGAHAAVVVTEWPELLDLPTAEVRGAMANPLIVDGRNLLDPEVVRAAGFAYEGIGRPLQPADVLPEIPEPEPAEL